MIAATLGGNRAILRSVILVIEVLDGVLGEVAGLNVSVIGNNKARPDRGNQRADTGCRADDRGYFSLNFHFFNRFNPNTAPVMPSKP